MNFSLVVSHIHKGQHHTYSYVVDAATLTTALTRISCFIAESERGDITNICVNPVDLPLRGNLRDIFNDHILL